MNKLLIALLFGLPGAAALAQGPVPPQANGLAAGLYVHVIDGAINLTNKGGTSTFAAGQFGYTASASRPPVVVPPNPGILFTPPPTFQQNQATVTAASPPKSNTVDCEVR